MNPALALDFTGKEYHAHYSYFYVEIWDKFEQYFLLVIFYTFNRTGLNYKAHIIIRLWISTINRYTIYPPDNPESFNNNESIF